ncbi:MAG: PAS domain S-box protein [Nitrospira sp.]|nr:PAS domain S-box protein [Nitrospira sp.]MBS0168490.1 PAS domain S-box protein [Nitrospira sp.]
MSLVKDLKTSVKLMLAFGMVGAIMAGVGYFGISTTETVNGTVKTLYEQELQGVSAIKDVNLAITGISRLTRAAIISTDQKEKEQFAQDIAGLTQRFHDRLSDFKQLTSLDEAKTMVSELEHIFPPYMAVMDEAVRLTLQNDNVNAIKKVHEVIPGAQQVMSRATKLASITEMHAEAVYKESLVLYERARNVLVGLIIGGICVGLILGGIISRMIGRSLGNLRQAVAKLAGGDLTARAVVESKDEIGQLAEAFNRMGEALEQSMAKQQEAIEEMNACVDIMNVTSIVSEGDLKGNIITANEKYSQVSQYSKEELLGKPHSITRHPDTSKEIFKTMWQTIGRGEIFHGVIKNRRKDGTPYYVDAVIKPIMGTNGKPKKYLGVRYDVTEYELARLNMKGIVDAINASYSMVEFDLNGNILSANSNCLQLLGYTINEIKGRHHRLFCEPVFSGSSEYQAFWQKLSRGDFDAGVYKHLTKGGKEVWLQASYNPVKDEMGRAYKIVMLAVDITGQKQAQDEVEKLIVVAATGQLSERIKTEQFDGAAKALTQSVNQLLDTIVAPLHEAQVVLTALASNDLRQEMTGSYQGEFEQMKTSLNSALRNLAKTIITVREAVASVALGADQITKGNEDLAQRTSEQAGSLEETSASMEEMTSTVKQNADNAKQANQLAATARETADKGGTVTKRAVDAMAEINKSSKKIADIITVIDEIAFQTNLLALNAAVEAARAGEHGRGFAVVAAEVRNLAQRSATAAKEIKGLINESIQRVTDGSELVDQSGKTLEEIVHSVKRVSDIIEEITAASQEQASGIDQVNKAIMAMDETTQQNAALVEETTSASQSMKEQAKELMRQIDTFRIDHAASTGSVKPISRSEASGLVGKVVSNKPMAAVKPTKKKERSSVTVGVVGHGRAGDAEFEEF